MGGGLKQVMWENEKKDGKESHKRLELMLSVDNVDLRAPMSAQRTAR